MKKILLASTALVLTAGAAAADVKVSGDGRMGVLYTEDAFTNAVTNNSKDWNFTSRLRINFSASGETDGGLTFGGSLRLDQEDEMGDRGSNGTAGSVFISSDVMGTLSMGDVSGGAEKAVGDLAGVGLTGLGDQNEFIYLFGGNDPSALYQYSVSGLTLSLGVSDDEEYSVGAGYAGDFWSVGLGYESVPAGSTIQIDVDGNTVDLIQGTSNDLDQWIGDASVTFAGVTLTGAYGVISGGAEDLEQYGVSAAYSFDALTLTGYFRELNADSLGKEDFYGVGAAYDLGGGASLVAGIAEIAGDKTAADFGISFSF